MALYSYGPTLLWPYIVMACQTILWFVLFLVMYVILNAWIRAVRIFLKTPFFLTKIRGRAWALAGHSRVAGSSGPTGHGAREFFLSFFSLFFDAAPFFWF